MSLYYVSIQILAIEFIFILKLLTYISFRFKLGKINNFCIFLSYNNAKL